MANVIGIVEAFRETFKIPDKKKDLSFTDALELLENKEIDSSLLFKEWKDKRKTLSKQNEKVLSIFDGIAKEVELSFEDQMKFIAGTFNRIYSNDKKVSSTKGVGSIGLNQMHYIYSKTGNEDNFWSDCKGWKPLNGVERSGTILFQEEALVGNLYKTISQWKIEIVEEESEKAS